MNQTFLQDPAYHLCPAEILHQISGGEPQELSYLVGKRCFIPDWVLVSFLLQLQEKKRQRSAFLKEILHLPFFVQSPPIKINLSVALFGFWNELICLQLTKKEEEKDNIRLSLKRYLQGTREMVEQQLDEISQYLIGSFFLMDDQSKKRSRHYQTLFEKVWFQSDPEPVLFLSLHSSIKDLLIGSCFRQIAKIPQGKEKNRHWQEVENQDFLNQQEFISINPDVLKDLKKQRSKKSLFYYLLLERERHFQQKNATSLSFLFYEKLPYFLHLETNQIKKLSQKLLEHGVLSFQKAYPYSIECETQPSGLQVKWFFSKFSFQAFQFEEKLFNYIKNLPNSPRSKSPPIFLKQIQTKEKNSVANINFLQTEQESIDKEITQLLGCMKNFNENATLTAEKENSLKKIHKLLPGGRNQKEKNQIFLN